MKTTTKQVAIYCRVSTSDQATDRQVSDLKAFCDRAGYSLDPKHIFIEVASGSKDDRKKRAEVMALAKGRHIDAVIVSELSRWGRSTSDLLNTIQAMADWGVSLIAENNKDLDVSSANGRLMLTVISAISQFEKDLLIERTKSGLAVARSKGRIGGRPKLAETDKAKAVNKHRKAVRLHLVAGESYRQIAKELEISKDRVMAISKEFQASKDAMAAAK